MTEPSGTVEAVAAQIAREVMASSFGLSIDECSADSSGALMIREGIRRYAALPTPSDQETWETINQWCDDTFGPATISKIIKRAKEEFGELEEDGANHAIEAPDVVICLCRIPGFAEALQEKMAINRKRQWRLTGDGTGYHIPERTPT